jgi:hypothetical protein
MSKRKPKKTTKARRPKSLAPKHLDQASSETVRGGAGSLRDKYSETAKGLIQSIGR